MEQQKHREISFDDVLAIIRRRALWIALPTVTIAILAIVTAYVLPPQYSSKALILIEQQKVPGEFVHSVVTEDINARLNILTEKIFSRTRLEPLIDRFGLYSDAKPKLTTDEKIEKLRKDVALKPITPEIARENGAPGFTISVNANQARVAQQVCAEIASMFLSENLKSREQSAEGTTEFLQGQLDEAKRALDEQDANMAGFQRQYMGQLPEQEQSNFNVLQSLNTQLDAATQDLARMAEDQSYMEATLAQQTASAEKTKASGDAPAPQQLEKQIEQQQTQLAALQARYTPDHPDVVKARRELEALKKQQQVETSSPLPPTESDAKNDAPQLQQLRLQLQLIKQRITQKKTDEERIQKEIKLYQGRLQLSPVVQEQYKKLIRDRETAQHFYADLLLKKNQSAMATDLERRQEGEQFRLMDPPNLPSKPTFPDRLLFALGGLAGGFCAGGALAALVEARDKTLRHERDVLFFTNMETLAVIPFIVAANSDGHKRMLLGWRRKQPKPTESALGERA